MSNELHLAVSPYLLQHKDNPVHWNEWGKKAWDLAQELNRPVLVSIGYASCHWCHVMEKECFEDDATADIMNESLICIKVDREERPDIDAFYMDACQLMTGGGGWPLNVFCLPDGRPLHAVTYVPKQNWQQLIAQIKDLYHNKNQSALDFANKLGGAILALNDLPASKFEINAEKLAPELIKAIGVIMEQADVDKGGLNRAPKFPLFSIWEMLLRVGKHLNMSKANELALLTTQKISLGGIYDNIEGGICRYATDIDWRIPHFEKMLYDNAQYLGLLATAWHQSKDDFFKNRIYHTLSFLEQNLLSEEGIFFGAIDADSEGVEGKYYVFSKQELKEVWDENSDWLFEYFDIQENGNFEKGLNVLHATQTPAEFADEKKLDLLFFEQALEKNLKALSAYRQKRIKPSLDHNKILAWNALLLTGLSKCAINLDDSVLKQKALKLKQAISQEFYINQNLLRIYVKDKKQIPALLEDYSCLIEGLIWCYQATGDEDSLLMAKTHTDVVLRHFFDLELEMFYNASVSHNETPVNKIEVTDDVMPSSNAIMCTVLRKLGHYFANPYYLNLSDSLLTKTLAKVYEFPSWHSYWLNEIVSRCYTNRQIVHPAGKNPHILLDFADITGSGSGNKQLLFTSDKTKGYYLCEDGKCLTPVNTENELIAQVSS